jgi:hypothetical protein
MRFSSKLSVVSVAKVWGGKTSVCDRVQYMHLNTRNVNWILRLRFSVKNYIRK